MYFSPGILYCLCCFRPGTETYHALVTGFAPETIIESEEPHKIDRKKLASLVFHSPQQLEKLNQIVWPRIASLIEEEIEKIQKLERSELPIVVVDAALLFDAGWDVICDEVREKPTLTTLLLHFLCSSVNLLFTQNL